MIASPNDVAGERAIVREVLAEWNAVHSARRGLVVLPLGWEVSVAPEMGDQPQAIINKRILADADLLIGIFWTRIGTPTAEYASGSVEEIEEHLAVEKPAMLYFSSAPVHPDSVDPKQYEALRAFRDSCKSRGVYESYNDLAEFRNDLSRALQIRLNEAPFIGACDAENGDASEIRVGRAAAPPALSREAQQLLKMAGQDPQGTILRLSYGGGTTVQSNDHVFTEDTNARSVALWEGAIEELESHGFLRAGSAQREVFSLTRKGYEAADTVQI
ncbi:MAG TPA: hypothetical protein VIP11_06670 [Gemmatimonadaceae bacterium]